MRELTIKLPSKWGLINLSNLQIFRWINLKSPASRGVLETKTYNGGRSKMTINNEGLEKKVFVGNGVKFSGEISGADEVRIDGKGDIKLETTKLVVGPGGWLKGNITCTDADVQGQLEGKIEVTSTLTIQEKGNVHGEIHYKQLQVSLGGQLAGDLQSSDGSKGNLPPVRNSPDKPVLLDSTNKG